MTFADAFAEFLAMRPDSPCRRSRPDHMRDILIAFDADHIEDARHNALERRGDKFIRHMLTT